MNVRHSLIDYPGMRSFRYGHLMNSETTQQEHIASGTERYAISMADTTDRAEIYRARHTVYAAELGQHGTNEVAQLSDQLDDRNVYIVARTTEGLAGFVSITPPAAGRYSIDKYFDRSILGFACDETLFEVRLLTVLKPHRGSELAAVLMYAALRWVEAHGGTNIVAIGRREVLPMYLRTGLMKTGLVAQSGALTYDLLQAPVSAIRHTIQSLRGVLARIEAKVDWQLPIQFAKPAACFHGGAFFERVGERFDRLNTRHDVINADVLDAWFDPSPRVLSALREHLPWLLKTSPPTACSGLIEVIAETRGIKPSNVLPGAGSSDLIFRCFREWLNPRSHVLILDPTYGEYAHVLERVVGCTVDRLRVTRDHGYDVDLDRLAAAVRDNYDLVVLVNPNSPTGRFIPRGKMESLLRAVPDRTRVWIDETYIDYAGTGQTLEGFAAGSENVVVCKSMSKVYALSGARVAYLCAGAHQLERLRAITPPWVVSLPAQVAAVAALQDEKYYQARWQETHALRGVLQRQLDLLGWQIVPGIANFLLTHVPDGISTARDLVTECRSQGLFIRDASTMGDLGERAVRIAVKDEQTNRRMVEILARMDHQVQE